MYERELQKRTGGARSSLIDKRVLRLRFSPIVLMFPVERLPLTRMIYLPRFVAVIIVIGPVL